MILRHYIEILFGIVFWIGTYYLLVQSFAIESIEIEAFGNQYERNIIYNESRILSIRLGLILKICYYYLNVYVITKIYHRKGWLNYLLLLIPVFIAFELLEVGKLIRIYSFNGVQLWENVLGLSILQYFLLTFLSFAHSLLKKSRKDEISNIQLLEQKKTAELQALKAQINPHFLFNALNNLLSISNDAKNEKASQVITQLSDMMRFLLDDSAEDHIPLAREVELIDNFIAINKLRFDDSDDIQIHFSKLGNLASKSIEPMLLLPFVENAFKHGVHAFKPSFVDIALELKEDQLYFQVRNSVHEKANENNTLQSTRSGIGIQNVRNRLDIIYPRKYDLQAIKKDNEYSVILNIRL